MKWPPPDAGRRRRAALLLAAGLAGSLAAHLLLLALLLRLPVPPPERARHAPIDVEVVERERPREPPPAAREPGPRPPGRPPPPPPRAAGGSEIPREPRLARPDLSVRPGRVLPPDAPPPAAEVRRRAPLEGPERLRASLLREQERVRIERGLADPYYGELGRALLRAWEPERAAAGDLGRRLARLGDDARLFARQYARRAARYGATGSPLDPDRPAPRAPETYGVKEGPTRDLLANLEVTRALRDEVESLGRTVVRVVQGPDGRLLSAEIASRSLDPALDAEVLRDVRALAERLPRPPARVAAGRDRIVSEWEMELLVSVAPTLAELAFTFDEVLLAGELRLPLGRRVVKRVRLLSVE